MTRTPVDEVFRLIDLELGRQENLKAAGKFQFTPRDRECPEVQRLAILTEEIGEVARAICDGNEENKYEELVQVAAVAVSWLLSRETGR